MRTTSFAASQERKRRRGFGGEIPSIGKMNGENSIIGFAEVRELGLKAASINERSRRKKKNGRLPGVSFLIQEKKKQGEDEKRELDRRKREKTVICQVPKGKESS